MAKRGQTSSVGGFVTGIALRDRIKKWLQDSGLYTSSNTPPGMSFMVQGRYPRAATIGSQPLNFFVIQQEDDNSLISIVSNIVFNDQHKLAFSALEEAKRREIMTDIQRTLWFRCGFSLQQDEKTKEILGIQLSQIIFMDPVEPLSKNALLHEIERLYRGYMFISWKLQEVVSPAALEQ